LDDELYVAVLERAVIEKRRAADLIVELVSTGLNRIENEDWLSLNRERLSRREPQITALVCLGSRLDPAFSRLA